MVPEDFTELLQELQSRPISENRYRTTAGSGRTQCFGVVGRRGLPSDISRQSWLRPKLYKLLLDFGAKHVPFAFTSVQVNDNYQAAAHRDKGNEGDSFLVAFGDYQGGALEVLEGDRKGDYDVRTPLIMNFSKAMHSVKPWTGHRYSLVFFNAKRSSHVPKLSVRDVDGKLVVFRGEEAITNGLPHPLKGRKKHVLGNIVREIKDVSIEFK